MFRRKGTRTILFERTSPASQRLVQGQIVTGTVKTVLPTAIVVEPLSVKEPARMADIEAVQGSGPRPVGWHPDGRVILFHNASALAGEITIGCHVSGYIYDEVETYIQVYAEKVTPSALLRATDASPAVAIPTTMPAKTASAFPPVHPFVPWILSELVPGSVGAMNPEVMGTLDARTGDQAFEDLVTFAFKVLDIGEVEQLGHKRPGERYPDGIIYCPEKKKREYIILFDAKERSGSAGYALTLDDERAFQEYVRRTPHAESIGEMFFVVVSSKFSTRPKSIPDATLVYLPAESLALLATLKTMNEGQVDHHSLKRLLLGGETISKKVIDDWSRDYGLSDLQDEFPAHD